MKVAAEICPKCEGTGWRPITNGPDRRVTRCDCRLQERAQALLAAARIPKRYEHCELSNFEYGESRRGLASARLAAGKFVEEYPVDNAGLLLIGSIGVGKTHLAVGIIKELIASKGISSLFYDYRELLKQIQNSYNPEVRITEFGILQPVFDAELLVIDELGAVIPTEWAWDTVSFIINTRYNNRKAVIITTNFEDLPAAPALAHDENVDMFRIKRAGRKHTLGDRIGDRMLSRLHEMCRIVKMDGDDFRQKVRSASFR